MSDTYACLHCGATVPAAAAFCTSCGQPMAAAAPGPAIEPPAPRPPVRVEDIATPEMPTPIDQTAIETPGLNDPTQIQAAPPEAVAPPSAPWAPPAPPQDPSQPSGPTGTAPWNPPATPPPPSWQQPQAPPDAATFGPVGGPPLGGGPGWTPSTPAPPGAWGAAPADVPKGRNHGSVLGGIVAIVGAALVIFGVFSGWVKLDTTGTVTGWSLTEGEGLLKSSDPYVIVALASIGGLLGILLFLGAARTLVRIATGLVGIGIVVVTALNWTAIASFVQDNLSSDFEATAAIGFYLAIAGGVLVAIAALLPAKK